MNRKIVITSVVVVLVSLAVFACLAYTFHNHDEHSSYREATAIITLGVIAALIVLVFAIGGGLLIYESLKTPPLTLPSSSPPPTSDSPVLDQKTLVEHLETLATHRTNEFKEWKKGYEEAREKEWEKFRIEHKKREDNLTSETVQHYSKLRRRVSDLEAQLSSVQKQLRNMKNDQNPPA